jgi:hypothetical protein
MKALADTILYIHALAPAHRIASSQYRDRTAAWARSDYIERLFDVRERHWCAPSLTRSCDQAERSDSYIGRAAH